MWLTSMRPLELAVFLKWALRVKRMEVEARGIKLWIDPASNVGKRILREGNYEANLTSTFEELLRPGQTVVEVGANEGWFSMLAAKLVGPTGVVVACEPQERLWPAILKNIALNDFAAVKLLPFAIGREWGSGEINLYPSLNTGSSHISGARRRWEKTQPIKVMPLSAVLDSLEGRRIDLLKIDIEGFELHALQGAGAHLGSSVKRIVVEVHPAQLKALGASAEDVTRLLESKGYRKRAVAGVDVWELP